MVGFDKFFAGGVPVFFAHVVGFTLFFVETGHVCLLLIDIFAPPPLSRVFLLSTKFDCRNRVAMV